MGVLKNAAAFGIGFSSGFGGFWTTVAVLTCFGVYVAARELEAA